MHPPLPPHCPLQAGEWVPLLSAFDPDALLDPSNASDFNASALGLSAAGITWSFVAQARGAPV